MKGVPLPKYRLTLLGRFELSGPDGLVELPSKKLAGLLAYLACTAPEPQPREKLSTLLWGSHFDAQAKQNLRQALFRLRKVLGQDALESDGEVVSLASGVIDCDVGRFEALIREGSRDSLACGSRSLPGSAAGRRDHRGRGLDRMAGRRARAAGRLGAWRHGEARRTGAGRRATPNTR